MGCVFVISLFKSLSVWLCVEWGLATFLVSEKKEDAHVHKAETLNRQGSLGRMDKKHQVLASLLE